MWHENQWHENQWHENQWLSVGVIVSVGVEFEICSNIKIGIGL